MQLGKFQSCSKFLLTPTHSASLEGTLTYSPYLYKHEPQLCLKSNKFKKETIHTCNTLQITSHVSFKILFTVDLPIRKLNERETYSSKENHACVFAALLCTMYMPENSQ